MRSIKLVLVGLPLLLLGITLFILIVPTVKATELGLREYLWAIAIIFSTCMGFGLCMIAILNGEALNTSDFAGNQEKCSSGN